MDQDPATDVSSESPLPQGKGSRFNPWIFFGVLLAPAILSIIVAVYDSSNYLEASLITLIVSSGIAGFVCGIHFTLAQRSMATWLKIVIGIISVIGCAGVAFALGMGGCSLLFMVLGN